MARVLTMQATIDALERSYRDLAATEGVCRPRIDIRIPSYVDMRRGVKVLAIVLLAVTVARSHLDTADVHARATRSRSQGWPEATAGGGAKRP